MAAEINNVLSVDVEEYFHALIFREAVGAVDQNRFPSRVARSVERVLSLLREHGARATCFVLGEVAEAHPELVRKIDDDGHEVACHGYRHDLVSAMTPAEFRADVRRAKALLEDLTGKAVIGYRAPNYSIGRGDAWAYDVLLEEGFRYDSSLYPILHDRYGQFDAPRFPHVIRQHGGRSLIEFPISTARLLGVNLPIGGGGYFRLLPETLTRLGVRRVNRGERQPIMFYFHPWELDAELPRPPMRWPSRLRHYVGIAREEAKLSRLLRRHQFTTARETLWPEGLPRA